MYKCFVYFPQSMKKYGKKITLTESERKDLELGYLYSHKQTASYKKAVDVFKQECADLLAQ